MHQSPKAENRWIMRYYTTRALVSTGWVALAFLLGNVSPLLAAALAAAYPAWDSAANFYDASRHGGLRANPTQAFNMVVSAIVTIAVLVATMRDFHAVVAVIGVWASLAGVLQLATAIRRWRVAGAQWPMILSGAQSALAGPHFVMQALDPAAKLGVASIAPYAAFGAIYFALSAAILAISAARGSRGARAA